MCSLRSCISSLTAGLCWPGSTDDAESSIDGDDLEAATDANVSDVDLSSHMGMDSECDYPLRITIIYEHNGLCDSARRVKEGISKTSRFKVCAHRLTSAGWDPPDPLATCPSAFVLLWSGRSPFSRSELSRVFVEAYRSAKMRTPILALVGCGVSDECVNRMLITGVSDVIRAPFAWDVLRVQLACIIARHWKIEDAMTSSRLLSNILPDDVVSELKAGKGRVTHSHACITVFFSDIVGFTDLCGKYDTATVVDMLHDVFSKFDAIAATHSVFKVETIGDAYMAVCGHDVATYDTQCKRVMAFAKEAMRVVARCPALPLGDRLRIRVGVHSGPASSGVIGTTRPHFCFFGQTINYASRMESTSVPMRAHVSGAAVARLADETGEEFISENLSMRASPVLLKGIGRASTWLMRPPPDVDVLCPPSPSPSPSPPSPALPWETASSARSSRDLCCPAFDVLCASESERSSRDLECAPTPTRTSEKQRKSQSARNSRDTPPLPRRDMLWVLKSTRSFRDLRRTSLDSGTHSTHELSRPMPMPPLIQLTPPEPVTLPPLSQV